MQVLSTQDAEHCNVRTYADLLLKLKRGSAAMATGAAAAAAVGADITALDDEDIELIEGEEGKVSFDGPHCYPVLFNS
jgi:hypothetical protein